MHFQLLRKGGREGGREGEGREEEEEEEEEKKEEEEEEQEEEEEEGRRDGEKVCGGRVRLRATGEGGFDLNICGRTRNRGREGER